MKSCAKCRRGYPDDAHFCAADGSELISASLVPAASDADPRLGVRLCDRYELRRVVADGGMGRVYEGIDKQESRRVAVKILHDSVASDEVALERFKREYEISSKLPHAHIVKVLDFQRDEVAGVWLLVMEFLEGEELRVTLKREHKLPPARVVRMLAQVAIGLDEAHARNYIHRDLKPDNVFLCGSREGDVVKLLDFGSAKDKNQQSKKLTVMGTTIGTPFYMAPEQAQGLETLDARADVFAMGAIAYECLAGKVPFGGTNGPQILLAIMTREPTPITDIAPELPAALEFVLEEALVKNPALRFASLGKLADAFGLAFGLSGSHRDWAYVPEAGLDTLIRDGLAAAKARTEADPFAAPRAGHPKPVDAANAGGFPPVAQHAGASVNDLRGDARAMDAAFAATAPAFYPVEPAPKARPPAVLIAGVVAALLVIAILGFVLMR
jgi:tRNA A-37 threonylcarbamoyl transferase component Bud32